MGHPAPSAGRRSAASAAGCPRCNLRSPSNAAAAACLSGSGREPFRRRRCLLAAEPCAGLDSRPRAAPHSRGFSPPATARHLAPRRSGSSPGCCRVVREVSEGSRRPSAVSGAPLPLRNQRHGAGALVRCISPLAAIPSRLWHVGRGVPRPGRVSPTDASVTPSAPGFPDYRLSRLRPYRYGDARFPRRAQVALDFRSVLRPRRSVGATTERGHHTRIISASLFLFC